MENGILCSFYVVHFVFFNSLIIPYDSENICKVNSEGWENIKNTAC
jgi:hypothetical protein